MFQFVAVLSLVWVSAGWAGEGTDVFRNPTVGFEVTKPSSWLYATAEQNAENLKNTELQDAEYRAAMLKYASVPLVMMMRHAEPYADLNPSFKVNVRPLGVLKGRSGVELIEVVLPQFEKAFHDFVVAERPKEVEISGLKGGYVRINYTLKTGSGESYATTSELWMVPRGDYFFMIGAGTRQDEKTGTRAEIAAIVKSIKIGK